ncbi:MAG: hypothetical protein ACO213_12490, partial [Steroidobacteraceae bacterium]
EAVKHEATGLLVRPADPGIGDGPPGDDLAIVCIDDEGPADDIAVPAGELEPVGVLIFVEI